MKVPTPEQSSWKFVAQENMKKKYVTKIVDLLVS